MVLAGCVGDIRVCQRMELPEARSSPLVLHAHPSRATSLHRRP